MAKILKIWDGLKHVEMNARDSDMLDGKHAKDFTLSTTFNSHNIDTTKHITALERTSWNNKTDLKIGASSSTAHRGDHGATAYTHSQASHARVDATNTSNSVTNGNITVNGKQETVYTHPANHSIAFITGLDAELSLKETVINSNSKIATSLSNAKSYSDNLYGNKIIDNRDIIPVPNDYDRNRTTQEFKYSKSVGLIGKAGTYVHVFTERAWADNSGGYVRQLAYDGLSSKIWTRYGSQKDDTWGDWAELANTDMIASKVENSLSITAGNGLSGGGDLSANRTLSLGTPGTLTNITKNSVSANSHTHAINMKVDSVTNRVTVDIDTNTVAIGISGFDINSQALSVYQNSTYIRNAAGTSGEYTVSGSNIVKNSGTWSKGTVIDFEVIRLV